MLLDALKELKDRGNSILVVEHDEETIREADTLIDLGPGAGQRKPIILLISGRRAVMTGSPVDLIARPGNSHTAKYLKKYLMER